MCLIVQNILAKVQIFDSFDFQGKAIGERDGCLLEKLRTCTNKLTCLSKADMFILNCKLKAVEELYFAQSVMNT